MSFEQGSLGQENVEVIGQVVPVPLAVIGACALGGLGWILWSVRGERRVRRLYLLVAYLFVGLAVLAKVLPGIVLPGMVLFFYFLVTGRWRELKKLEIGRGLVVLAIVILPWYLAVVFRHGGPFIDRIIFHDIVNRAVVGVHGDTGTMEYYLQQLGYGMFPWLSLIPLALFGFAWLHDSPLETPAGRSRVFTLIWAISFFVFFSAVITKFHHYVFPTLVPLAILVGLAFDDLVARRIKRPEPLVMAGLALTIATGWDLVRPDGAGKAGFERFVDLFIYNYHRVWPEGAEYDYTGALIVLVSIVALLSLPLAIPPLRRVLSWTVVVAALIFSGWCLDVYMAQVGVHWSQESLIREYYERRDGPDERLVAYQMNWKGENYYTGNRVVVRVSLETGEFERWVREHAGERHFFMTERSRFEGLRAALNRARPEAGTRMVEIGSPPGPDRGALCNKFRMGVTTL
jgi:4-amino-4-deoxy-L-arabinose transferase-like glycosyltransferase